MRARWALLGLAVLGCSDGSGPSPKARSAASVASASTAPAPTATAPASTSTAPAPPDSSGGAFAPPDWPAWQAAEDACADCHPGVVDAWRASPMGQSLAPAPFALPPGLPQTAKHPITGVEYRAAASDGGLTVSAQQGDAREAQPATHVIGSGMHTQSFLWRDADGAHRVLPLTWYSQASRWDFTPGYAVAGHPDFDRPVKAECLYCHGNIAPMAGADDGRYSAPLQAIGCSRCHGDARAHVAGRMRGEATPLLVPTRLDPAREAAICETCHLQGAVRVLRPGRSWQDVAPGQPPGQVVATFVRKTPGAVTIASHGERLRLSACAPAEGPLLCTTCHAPHAQKRSDRAAACRGCHGDAAAAKKCAGAGTPDCVACHMQTVGTADIPHVAITDHFIQRRPVAVPPAGAPTGPLVRLQPADLPAKEAVALQARAYTEALRSSGAASDRAAAEAAFAQVKTMTPDLAFDRGSLALMAGDLAGARAQLEAAFAQRPDARTAAALADLRLRMGDLAGADAALVAAKGGLSVDRLQIAIAAAKGDPGAVEAAQRWVDRRPLDANARNALGLARQAQRDLASAHAAFVRATELRPDLPLGWLNRARVALMLGRVDDALIATRDRPGAQALRVRALAASGQMKAATERARGLPVTPDVMVFALRVALKSGDVKTATQLLDPITRALPTDPVVWRLAAEVLTRSGDPANAARARAQAQRLTQPQPQPRP